MISKPNITPEWIENQRERCRCRELRVAEKVSIPNFLAALEKIEELEAFISRD